MDALAEDPVGAGGSASPRTRSSQPPSPPLWVDDNMVPGWSRVVWADQQSPGQIPTTSR